MAQRKLSKEVEGYIKRIGEYRADGKFGRAVQLCDSVLEIADDRWMRNVILEFKGDSLYRVGRRTKDDEIVQSARTCYREVLKNNPRDIVAKRGVERIDRYF
jgi:hypothetical protein